MSREPLVTVITLIYNTGKYVIQALESVRNQTYKNIQHIVIDDFSTDDSVAIVKDWISKNNYPCDFLQHEYNMGVCKSLNDGLKLAKGEYVNFVSDDLIDIDKIEKLVKAFQALDSDFGIVYGDIRIINENNEVIAPSYYKLHLGEDTEPASGIIIENHINKCPVHLLGALIRKSTFDDIGFFDEELVFEDWDMNFRIARKYKFFYTGFTVASYRKLTGQMTEKFWNDSDKYILILLAIFKMYEKHLDLRKEYRNRIIKEMKYTHLKMLKLDTFRKADNLRISKLLLKLSPGVESLILYVMSFLNMRSQFLFLRANSIRVINKLKSTI